MLNRKNLHIIWPSKNTKLISKEELSKASLFTLYFFHIRYVEKWRIRILLPHFIQFQKIHKEKKINAL